MLNQYVCIGRITKDLDLKKTQSNKSVLLFDLAVDDGKRGDQRITQFISCQAWEGLADTIARYCQKGDLLQVSGRLVNNNYEYNGTKQYSYKVVVNGITLLANRKSENGNQKSENVEYVQPSLGGDLQRPEERNEFKYADIKSDDLPFY